jgi:predicted chitinase
MWRSAQTPIYRKSATLWVARIRLCSKRSDGWGLRVKKDKERYQEQKPERVAEYLAQIAGASGEQLAYVDETGMDTYLEAVLNKHLK